jgi:signal transduction histidine kinase
LLYWGKSQIGGKRINITTFNPAPNIEASIVLLKTNAGKKHISVVNNTQSCGNITGDAAHFDFILRNLLANAVKFTRPGGTIHVNAAAGIRKGYVVFSVADNGVGIPAEKLPAIFEPFINNSAGTALEKGTGIGLMLCHEFVLENSGDIWVESKLDEGTTFFFSFPAA